MRHVSRRDALSMTSTTKKPPKLRYKPGTFVQDAKGQLYCIRVIFRLRDNPHEWIYELEYRDHMSDPSTYASTLCGALSGDPHGMSECVVLWEPLYSSMDVSSHALCRKHVSLRGQQAGPQ